ncbi:LAMP3 protein, partial [Himantopus himantopus]|nr:LAMP3 protein [Himantopus himantopus]
AGQATMETVTPAEKNTTINPMSSTKEGSTHVSTEMTAAATNTTIKHTTPNTQMTTAATTTTATTMQTVKSTTASGNQTTAPRSSTATAMTNTTTVHPGTQTTIPSTTTVRPTLAPRPSPIPTGTYTVSNGNMTCIKAVMGLQLMAQNTQKKQMEYMAVSPNATQTSGSCGTVQSELNITFSGGFINFTFVK